MPTLGRLVDVETYNARRLYGMSRVQSPLSELQLPQSAVWKIGPVLDQGPYPTCVGHGGRAWLEAEPNAILDPDVDHDPLPLDLYREAQAIDGFPNPHDGTTVRALMKVLNDKGHIGPYLWAQNWADFQTWLSTRGPVVVGMNWYQGMFTPDDTFTIRVTGPLAGGHCVLLYGIDNVSRRVFLQNSWGTGWGNGGTAVISFVELNELLFSEGGECAAALEPEEVIPPAPAPAPVQDQRIVQAYDLLGQVLGR